MWPFDSIFNAGVATGDALAGAGSAIGNLPGDVEAAKVAAERFAVAVLVGLAIVAVAVGVLAWKVAKRG